MDVWFWKDERVRLAANFQAMFLHVGEIVAHEEMGLPTGIRQQGSVEGADSFAPHDSDFLK